VLVALAAQGLVGGLGHLILGEGPGLGLLVGAVLDGVLLGLLLHPDSREWVARPREAAVTTPG